MQSSNDTEQDKSANPSTSDRSPELEGQIKAFHDAIGKALGENLNRNVLAKPQDSLSDKRLSRGGEACVQSSDGTVSSYPLQDDLTDGVADSDFRAQTRAKLLEAGVPVEDLDRVLPMIPNER